jgi:hypothetical protein
MADSTLNISVSVTNVKTLDDARVELKRLNKELGGVALDNIPRQKELGAEIVRVKNIIGDATAATVTANGKMMKSYFSTGEELRRFYREQRVGDRTMREATSAIGGFGSMLGGEGLGKIVGTATQRFQEMEFAVHGVGIAAQSGSAAMASWGQKLMSMAGPLAGIAAAIGLLSLAMAEQRRISDELNKSLEKGTELGIASGRISKEQQIAMLRLQLAQAGKGGVSPGLIPSILGSRSMMEDMLLQASDRANKLQEIQSKINALLGDGNKKRTEEIIALEEIYDLDKDDAAALKEQVEYKKELARWNAMIAQSAKDYQDAYLKRAFDISIGKEKKPGRASGLPLVQTDESKKSFLDYTDQFGKMTDDVDTLNASTMAYVDTLSQMSTGLMQAAEQAGQTGASFGSMARGIIKAAIGQTIAQVVGDALAKNAFPYNLIIAAAAGSAAAALFETVIPKFAEGGLAYGPTLAVVGDNRNARNDPEVIAPLSKLNAIGQAGRYGGGSMQPFVQVFPIVSSAGISVQVEVGNRMNKRRRY